MVIQDEMFARAFLLRGGTADELADTVAFAYGRQTYLRRGSVSILNDTVHEGTHALDFLRGFSGTTQQWERRAWFAEREFLMRLNLPVEPSGQRQLLLDLYDIYGP